MSGTLIKHCAVFGTKRWPFRKFRIGSVRPYAQYEKSVTIGIVPPRKRKWEHWTAQNDNLTYFTIEDADGVEVYDSRSQVPCDMDRFQNTKGETEWVRQ
jgi:hypothetical protein